PPPPPEPPPKPPNPPEPPPEPKLPPPEGGNSTTGPPRLLLVRLFLPPGPPGPPELFENILYRTYIATIMNKILAMILNKLSSPSSSAGSSRVNSPSVKPYASNDS